MVARCYLCTDELTVHDRAFPRLEVPQVQNVSAVQSVPPDPSLRFPSHV